MSKETFANLAAVVGVVVLGVVGMFTLGPAAAQIGLAASAGLVGFLGGKASA